MPLSESQLQGWSGQGAITSAKQTHDSIRRAIESVKFPPGVTYEVYLQGSYKNDTNIRGDSDVDVVVELTSTFYSNLTAVQKSGLNLTPAEYQLSGFVRDVFVELQRHFGASSIVRGNKCINLTPASGRLPADIIPCANYRWYSNNGSFTEGITFRTHGDNRQIISYPKVHSDLCTRKNSETGGRFKPSVRVFKHARSNLVDQGLIDEKVAPSHFLESLLYAVPAPSFSTSLQLTFYNVLTWLTSLNRASVTFPSKNVPLFGSEDGQWAENKAQRFIGQVVALWNRS